jgi:hypothetical protein
MLLFLTNHRPTVFPHIFFCSCVCLSRINKLEKEIGNVYAWFNLFYCLHSGYRHPVLNLIVGGGDILPDIKGILPEANNVPSLQTRLPNVRSDSVIHSYAQWASEVAGSCPSYCG